MDNPVLRMTWQVSPRNKFAAYMDRAMRFRGHAMGSLTDSNTASVVWHTPTFATGSAKWTSTVSSKLLLEAGFSFNRERYDNVYQPGIDQPRADARAGTPARARATTAPACCGMRRARSSATIRTNTTLDRGDVLRHRLALR